MTMWKGLWRRWEMSPVDGEGRGLGLKLTFTNKSSLVNIVTTAGEGTEDPRGRPPRIRGHYVAPVTNQRSASEWPLPPQTFYFLWQVRPSRATASFLVTSSFWTRHWPVRSRARDSDVRDRLWPGSAQVCAHCSHGSVGGLCVYLEMLPTSRI